MDEDATPVSNDGAEDVYYFSTGHDYRTSGQPLADLNELLRIKGYTAGVVTALLPYVSVLPGPSAINVNTAPAETLMLVADGLSLADARLLVAARDRAYFRDLADFRVRLPAATHSLDGNAARTTSEFFAVDAQVRHGAAFVHAQAIVQRGSRPWPTVIWQRYD
jgi:general secretion pathway protein K